MDDFKKTPTSPEVYAVIQATHRNQLEVFLSYSAPDGDQFGNSSQGVMETGYGFKGSDYPLIIARTTWSIDRENLSNRVDEIHQYWLCIGIKDFDA